MSSIEKKINDIVESIADRTGHNDSTDEKSRQNSLPFLHLGDRRASNKDAHHLTHSPIQVHNKPSVLDAFHRDAFANRFSDDYGKLPGEDGVICYGNKIALKHTRSGRYLHSETAMIHSANLALKKNLQQFHVNSQNWTPHEEQDYWLVLPCLGQSQLLGKPVPYNKELRLQHCQNKGHLRPLKDEPRPLSSEGEKQRHSGEPAESPLEIVTYPESLSDKHDVWKIQYFVFSENWESAKAHRISERENDKVWKVDDIILLRHKVSKKVLRSNFEGKGEPKLPKAPVECTDAADMASIWRVVVPMILEDEEIMVTPITPVFKESMGRKSKSFFLK